MSFHISLGWFHVIWEWFMPVTSSIHWQEQHLHLTSSFEQTTRSGENQWIVSEAEAVIGRIPLRLFRWDVIAWKLLRIKLTLSLHRMSYFCCVACCICCYILKFPSLFHLAKLVWRQSSVLWADFCMTYSYTIFIIQSRIDFAVTIVALRRINR